MKGMILLANGFEDMEMITTLDLLRRANIEVYTFAVKDEKRVLSQSRVYYESDYLLKDAILSEYDFLVIPGGKAVFNDLQSDVVDKVIMDFVNRNKLINPFLSFNISLILFIYPPIILLLYCNK